jgi:hypothetical protein
MSSNICPENEQFIEHELESGTYQNRGELLDDAVRLFKLSGGTLQIGPNGAMIDGRPGPGGAAQQEKLPKTISGTPDFQGFQQRNWVAYCCVTAY